MDTRKKVARELLASYTDLTYTQALRMTRSVIPATRIGTSSPAQLEARVTIALALMGHPLAYRASPNFSSPGQLHRLFSYDLVTLSGDVDEYRFDTRGALANVTNMLVDFPMFRYTGPRASDGRAEITYIPSGATITGPYVENPDGAIDRARRGPDHILSAHEKILIQHVQNIPDSARMLLASVLENLMSPLVVRLDHRGKQLPDLPHVWGLELNGAGTEWVLHMRGEPAAVDAVITAMTTRHSHLPGCRLRSMDTIKPRGFIEVVAELGYGDARLSIAFDNFRLD